MNLSPELAVWVRPMALIAAEVTVLVGLAGVVERRMRSAAARRTLWQGCLLGILGLLVLELSGAGRELMVPLAATRLSSSPASRSASPDLESSAAAPGSPESTAAGRAPGSSRLDPRIERTSLSGSSAAALQLRKDFRLQVADRITGGGGNGSPPRLPGRTADPAPRPESAPMGSGLVESAELTWLGLGWGLGAGLLLLHVLAARILTGWLRHRSRQVTDAGLVAMGESLARRLHLRTAPALRLSARLKGPIAFGLWRPTIVLPVGLAGRFSPAQLEAVLAHETAHLAARDPAWYALADATAALLWWHPLVWWARNRLRRTSESAADVASVLVPNGPQVLAECLVELGNRFAQRETLGWLSVSGFRSQLGRRVEHLLSLSHGAWTPPGRWRPALAKALGAAALVALTLFGTAWALPRSLTQGDNMKTIRHSWKQSLAAVAVLASAGLDADSAQAPGPTPPPPAPPPAVNAPAVQPGVAPAPAPAAQNTPAQPPLDPQLAARYGLQAGTSPAASSQSTPPPPSEVTRQKLMQRYGINAPAAGGRRFGGAMGGGSGGGLGVAGYGGGGFGGGGGSAGPVSGSALSGQLDQIRFNEVEFDGIPLPEVLKYLNEQTRGRDPEKTGINFLINPNTAALDSPGVDPTTGHPLPAPEPPDMNSVMVRFNLPLRDVRLRDVLDAVVKVADRPIQYAVTDYAVVFSLCPDPNPAPASAGFPSSGLEPLMVRTFKVDTNTFAAGLERAFGIRLEAASAPADSGRSKQMQTALRELLTQLGISMEVAGKAVFYNELTGVVMVRATGDDLEIVKAAVETLGGSLNDAEMTGIAPQMSEAMRQRYGLQPARR